MQPTEDSALLQRYVENHSDEAFAGLVTRHINLVYSVALRQVGNPHAAEEITQAVFIILAKKAVQLRHHQALSSWLFQATRLTAGNFIRSETRRYRREEEAYMQSVLDEAGTEVWPRIAPLLDTAVAGLREKDRQAIVLRFYEGRNLREVGLALGTSEDAAEKRVNRTLEKLRKFFTKRGVSSTAGMIAGAISANSVQAAPVALAKTVTVAAVVKGSIATASIITLVKGTMKTMTWLKIKFAVGLIVVALLAGGAATMAVSQTSRNDNGLTLQEIARQTQDTYAALTSYIDSGTVMAVSRTKTITNTFHIRLQRPEFYRIDWSQTPAPGIVNKGAVWSSGEGHFMQYSSQGEDAFPAPQKSENRSRNLEAASGFSSEASVTIPSVFFGDNRDNFLRLAVIGASKLTKESDANVGGVDCYVFTSIVDSSKSGGKLPDMTFWIGKKDHFIHQTRQIIDTPPPTGPIMTDENIKSMLAKINRPATPQAIAAVRKSLSTATTIPPTGRYVFTETHDNISVNEKFSPSDFKR